MEQNKELDRWTVEKAFDKIVVARDGVNVLQLYASYDKAQVALVKKDNHSYGTEGYFAPSNMEESNVWTYFDFIASDASKSVKVNAAKAQVDAAVAALTKALKDFTEAVG